MKDSLEQAIVHLEAGDWEAAHAIVQSDDSRLGSWAHGIVHTIEGDVSNAQYWYRKAEREFPGTESVATEISALRDAAGTAE